MLRSCMSEASSSSMPAVVGHISGVDVLMESQILTITPQVSKRIVELSFSAPATTTTTLYVSGDTIVSPPFKDSEA